MCMLYQYLFKAVVNLENAFHFFHPSSPSLSSFSPSLHDFLYPSLFSSPRSLSPPLSVFLSPSSLSTIVSSLFLSSPNTLRLT